MPPIHARIPPRRSLTLSDRNFDPDATRKVATAHVSALADTYEHLEQLVVDARPKAPSLQMDTPRWPKAKKGTR